MEDNKIPRKRFKKLKKTNFIGEIMSRAIWNMKLATIVQREKELEFPEFMKQVRKTLGFSRKTISEDTGMPQSKLITLEYGYFQTMQKDNTLETLADYYELPLDFIKRKCKEYCRRKRAKSSFFPSFHEKHPEFEEEVASIKKSSRVTRLAV